MAKQHAQYGLVRMLYIEQGMTAKEISGTPGITVSENTISKWVNNENWKEQRQALTLSPHKLIKYYYEQSEAIVNKAKQEDRPIDAGEADALNKLASAIEKLDRNVNPSVMMSVFTRFNNYLVEVEPQLTKQVVEHQMNFLQTIFNEGE